MFYLTMVALLSNSTPLDFNSKPKEYHTTQHIETQKKTNSQRSSFLLTYYKALTYIKLNYKHCEIVSSDFPFFT